MSDTRLTLCENELAVLRMLALQVPAVSAELVAGVWWRNSAEAAEHLQRLADYGLLEVYRANVTVPAVGSEPFFSWIPGHHAVDAAGVSERWSDPSERG